MSAYWKDKTLVRYEPESRGADYENYELFKSNQFRATVDMFYAMSIEAQIDVNEHELAYLYWH